MSETTSELLSVLGTKKELSDVEEPEMMHIVEEDLIDLTIQSPSILLKYISTYFKIFV